MWCPTKSLAKYISENYIAKYKPLDGVRFLKKALHKDSVHHQILINLEGQLYDLRKREIVGILEDQFHVREANNRLYQFLEYLQNNEKPYIFVYKNSGLDRKVSGVIDGNNPNNYLDKTNVDKSGWKLEWNFNSLKSKTKKIFGFAIIILIVFIFTKFSVGTKSSPLDQVTSWGNEDADLWAIHLRSFATLENSLREKEAFQSRDISIVKLDDGRFYLFIFHKSKISADDEFSGKSIKRRWKNSRVIPIDLCTPTKSINENYYECK